MGVSAACIGTADRLLEDSFRLANLVFDSGSRPTHIVGIWRGGAPVGIAVQDLLAYNGIEADHISIRTASYTGIDQHELFVAAHVFSGSEQTLGGYYSRNDSVMVGWQAKF